MTRALTLGAPLLSAGWLLAGAPGLLMAQREAALRARIESRGGQPVVGASVRIRETNQTFETEAGGWFVWPGPGQGVWTVDVRAIGFLPTTFRLVATSSGLTPARLLLTESAQHLPDVDVTAEGAASGRLAEFDRRRRLGSGRFFTRDVVARTAATSISSLLRILPAGVRVVDSAGTPLAVSNRGQKVVSDGGFFVVPCVLRVVIDGQVQPWGTSLDIIEPSEVVGIEVYLGPSQVPAEFAAGRRDQFCGLLVFWTGGS